MLSEKTVGRLSLYRRLLAKLQTKSVENVFSHELSAIAHGTPAQVRRDLMLISFTGSPAKGYNVQALIDCIDRVLDAPEGQMIALIGIGNLGRAILSYFHSRRPKLTIVAAFDNDPAKVNSLVHGCRAYPLQNMAETIRNLGIHLAVVTVPAESAQAVANTLVSAGVKGILNFAPVPLNVPSDVYVEDIDVTMLLEKTAYFARNIGSMHSKESSI
jgi:redox-sensing transcriptional repressor